MDGARDRGWGAQAHARGPFGCGQEVGVELEAVYPADILVDRVLVALALLAVLVVENTERSARRLMVEPIEPPAERHPAVDGLDLDRRRAFLVEPEPQLERYRPVARTGRMLGGHVAQVGDELRCSAAARGCPYGGI